MGNQWGLRLHLMFATIFLVAAITKTCFGVQNITVSCFEHERLALLEFKRSVNDTFEMLSSWVGNDSCHWERVRCDLATGHVESLHLGGTISKYYVPTQEYKYLADKKVKSSLADLSQLKYLDLSGNYFQESRIPKFIGSFKHLTYLNLSYGDFSGNIPHHIGNLSNLKVLDLKGNIFQELKADVAWMYGLSSLKYLDLSYVDLSGAKNYDIVFYMIPSLEELRLAGCGMSGHIPLLNSSATISKMKHLDLGFNKFNGFNLSMPLNFANLLNNIPSLQELHLSFCSLQNIHLSPTHLNISTLSNIQLLDLSRNPFEGNFPSVLTNLTNLRGLHLLGNKLTGQIPEESLVRLRLLEVLDLSYNQFNGSVPESLGSLGALKVLILSGNSLTGPIPVSLGRLVSLQSLSVSSNLLNGTIPVQVWQLTKLHKLDVSNNCLEGVVSEAHFYNLSMLNDLSLAKNKLTFNISREWMPPFQLTSVDLSSCKIENEFPQWIRTQRKLDSLVLSNNSILGRLPTWLRKMPIIRYLDLSHNNLSGPLTNLPNRGTYDVFNVLFLQNNLFNESIPWSLCRITNLEILNLSRNRLTGKIPTCIGNLKKLIGMIFSSNRLSGVIPSSIAPHNSSLRWLNLNDNNLGGVLPRELGNLGELYVLDLGDNKFSGNIPEWIGEKLRELIVFRLHKNNFSGRIPQSLCKNSNLQILDVAHNNLTGPVPHCLGGLNGMATSKNEDQILTYLDSYDAHVIQCMKGVELEYSKTLKFVINMDLSSNKLVGGIPTEITALVSLVGLNMSNNLLTGSIPDNIGKMDALNSLDFSGNQLTGMIPQSMADLHFLSHLNLSHNNLSGRIPTGNQLQTLNDPSIYVGNKELCGAPLPRNCSNHEDLKTTHNKAADEPKMVWFYLDVACGFATGFWGIIGVLVFKKQWRHKLFLFSELTMDKIYVAVMVRVANMKRRYDAA